MKNPFVVENCGGRHFLIPCTNYDFPAGFPNSGTINIRIDILAESSILRQENLILSVSHDADSDR